MGREIRRVPPNWEHPKYTNDNAPYSNRVGEFKPLFDEAYEPAMSEWIENHLKWLRGEHKDQKDDSGSKYQYYAEWSGNPPDVESYRPNWKEVEATWYQVYETVSEGTPVTPPFETQDKVIEYLVANGDFWDQKRRLEGRSVMPCDPWSREAAESFVKERPWMPSMAMIDGKILSGATLAEHGAKS